jgi:hypothetical protein
MRPTNFSFGKAIAAREFSTRAHLEVEGGCVIYRGRQFRSAIVDAAAYPSVRNDGNLKLRIAIIGASSSATASFRLPQKAEIRRS